jgi:hypothetical protein
MKNLIVLLLIQNIFISSIHSQNAKGKVIYNNNETAYYEFKIPLSLLTKRIEFEELQKEIVCFDSTGNKIKVLPENVKEISFSYENRNYKMLSVFTIPKSLFYSENRVVNFIKRRQQIFMLLIEDGKLQLFKYFKEILLQPPIAIYIGPGYDKEDISGGIKIEEKYAIRRGSEVFNELLDDKHFSDDMSFYFSDCPSLSNKIANKELRRGHFLSIVKYYNSNCTGNISMTEGQEEKFKDMKASMQLQKIYEVPDDYFKIKYKSIDEVKIGDIVRYRDYNNDIWFGIVSDKVDKKCINVKILFPEIEVVKLKFKSVSKMVIKKT